MTVERNVATATPARYPFFALESAAAITPLAPEECIGAAALSREAAIQAVAGSFTKQYVLALTMPALAGVRIAASGVISQPPKANRNAAMALWKESTGTKPSPSPFSVPANEPAPAARFEPPASVEPTPAPVRAAARDTAKSESLIAPDIAIEGKIEGSGHVRIAGRFKGDVDVRGDLTIEHGAKVTGSVRADKVIIAGELVGNIEAASRVELTQSGSLTGDVKAASLTVAAGSRMRGQADFGWEDGKSGEARKSANGNGADHGKIA